MNGFPIGYEGNRQVKQSVPNRTLNVGDETILWNKVMKEVHLNRYAGPFNEVPFEFFIQSPIGLVPKSNGDVQLSSTYPTQGKQNQGKKHQ